MKKLLVLFLSIALILTMNAVFITQASANGQVEWIKGSGFNNGAPTDLANSSLTSKGSATFTTEPLYRDATNGNALSITAAAVEEKPISLGDAPCFREMVYCTGKSARKGITVAYDVCIKDYVASYTNYSGVDDGKIFGLVMSNGSGRYYLGNSFATTFKTDGTVGGQSFAKNKWYRIEVITDYRTHEARALLTDKETNVTTTIASGVKFDSQSYELGFVDFEFYRPATVALDLVQIFESPAFAIYSPIDGGAIASSARSVKVGIADDALSASFYVDGALVQNITPGTSTANDGLYTIPFATNAGGYHRLTLKQTTINGEYEHEIMIKENGYSESTVMDYGFGANREYPIGQATGGGVGNAAAGSFAALPEESETKTETKITYNSQTGTTIFVRSALSEWVYGDVVAEYKVMPSQTTEDIALEIEFRDASRVKKTYKYTVLNKNGVLQGKTTAYSAGTWYSLKAVMDTVAGKLSYYVDDTEIATQTYPGEPAEKSTKFLIKNFISASKI